MLLIAILAGCAVVALAAGVATLAALAPGRFRLERSVLTAAPRNAVWPLIADLRAWMRWSPWQSPDDRVIRTYTGPSCGIGAREQWTGTDRTGDGIAEITLADPDRIVIHVRVLRPQARQATLEFHLAEEGGATRITWIMSGEAPYAARLAGIMFGLAGRAGKDFDAGLSRLKAIAERDECGAL